MTTLEEFLRQTNEETQQHIGGQLESPDGPYPYQETAFAEIVMQHLHEIGMTYEPVVCHYAAKVRNARLRLSGYAISEDIDQLDLFVSLYDGSDALTTISDTDTKTAAEQCLRFLSQCAEGNLASTMDDANDAHAFAVTIQGAYGSLEQIRIFVLTDRQARTKNFKPRDVAGKTVKLEVMDIERLHRHWSEGKPRDELVVNFEEVAGSALPCVYVPGQTPDYDYALTVIPGEALRYLYEKFGARLLEANVRSFLSTTGKVNSGIRTTLKAQPDRFMAYNNGIVIVADEVTLGRTADGAPAIAYLKGMQIVNGGQTTASLYFVAKKDAVDLRSVRVPAKVIILHSEDLAAEESLISSISRFANSQNAVKQSDLSANRPFHVELEKLAQTTYIPDGVGRWFYERAAGSYKTLLAREATTPAKRRHLTQVVIPTSRKITKTDLAKYLTAWNQRPDLVSLGSQKNFERYMEELDGAGPSAASPDVVFYKQMIAKAILFKEITKLVRPMFPAFQANVGTYLVAVVAHELGHRMKLDRIWGTQSISGELKELLRLWAVEVNEVLHRSAAGRMVSEWAKKPACWEAVREASLPTAPAGIPELAYV